MGFTNPFTSSIGSTAGKIVRNKLLGNTGTTDTSTSGTDTGTANVSNPTGFLGHDKDWWFGDNSIYGQIKNGIFGTGSATPSTQETVADPVVVDPVKAKTEKDWDNYNMTQSPAALMGALDTSPTADIDLYNNVLNGYVGQANDAYGNAVNGINSVDLTGAYNDTVANLIRGLSSQGANTARTTGASMATRGLAGSGAYNNAMNNINSSTNANIASGITSASSDLAKNKLAQQEAVANILNNQASTLANIGTTAADNNVQNKYQALLNSLAVYGIKSNNDNQARQIMLQENSSST